MAHNHEHDRQVRYDYDEEPEEEHVHSEGNVDLYTHVGHVGLLGVALATYFMWYSNSHTAFGDVLHGVADVSTVYVMAYFARLHKRGDLSKVETNQRAALFNTALLAVAALGVWMDLHGGHREMLDPWRMGTTAGILLVSNLIQFWMMHTVHGHEHRHDTHVSMFSSTIQHLFSDILFDLGALCTALAATFSLFDAVHLDEYVARILICILVIMTGKNILKLIRHEELELH